MLPTKKGGFSGAVKSVECVARLWRLTFFYTNNVRCILIDFYGDLRVLTVVAFFNERTRKHQILSEYACKRELVEKGKRETNLPPFFSTTYSCRANFGLSATRRAPPTTTLPRRFGESHAITGLPPRFRESHAITGLPPKIQKYYTGKPRE